jgi:hypothetical protein
VVPLTQVPAALRDTWMEWRNTRAASLLFTHRDTAILALVALIGLCFAILAGRALTRKKAGRTQVALPAVLDWSGRNWTAIVRHGALLLFLAGLPFFTLALSQRAQLVGNDSDGVALFALVEQMKTSARRVRSR